jgi:electron transport complex protein RnfC
LFPGGIHPREGANGKAVNSGNAIRDLAAPKRVTIPLSQHIGAPAKPIVEKGERVLVGQKIAEAGGFVSAPVHASVSGRVVEIGTAPMPSGLRVPAIVIDNDFQDEWGSCIPRSIRKPWTPSRCSS